MADVCATSVAPGGLLTSPEDKRLYRRLELPNGLVAILVHDPHMAAHGPAVSPGCLRWRLAIPLTARPQDESDEEMEEDEEDDAEEEAEEEDAEGEDEEPAGAPSACVPALWIAQLARADMPICVLHPQA